MPTFDHHCIWLNQCVGELNYRYFLAFLLTHVVFFAYAVFVITSIIVGQVKDEDLFDVVFKDTSTGQEYAADFWTVTQYIMVKNIYLSMLNIFAAIMDLVLFGFFSYHLYLVSLGQTTNESFKWASIKQVQSKLVSAYKKFAKQGLKEEICNPAKAEAEDSVPVVAEDLVGSSLITDAGSGASLHDLSMKGVHGAVDTIDKSKGVTLGHAQKDANDSDGSDDAVGGGYVCVESLSVTKIPDESIQLSVSVSDVSVVDTKNTALEASDSAVDGVEALSGVLSSGLNADKITHVLSPPNPTPTRHPIRTFIDGTYSLPDVLEESPLPLPANIYNKGIFSGLR